MSTSRLRSHLLRGRRPLHTNLGRWRLQRKQRASSGPSDQTSNSGSGIRAQALTLTFSLRPEPQTKSQVVTCTSHLPLLPPRLRASPSPPSPRHRGSGINGLLPEGVMVTRSSPTGVTGGVRRCAAAGSLGSQERAGQNPKNEPDLLGRQGDGAQRLSASRSCRSTHVPDQGPKVLHRRDQQVLDPLAP